VLPRCAKESWPCSPSHRTRRTEKLGRARRSLQTRPSSLRLSFCAWHHHCSPTLFPFVLHRFTWLSHVSLPHHHCSPTLFPVVLHRFTWLSPASLPHHHCSPTLFPFVLHRFTWPSPVSLPHHAHALRCFRDVFWSAHSASIRKELALTFTLIFTCPRAHVLGHKVMERRSQEGRLQGQ
jgi:hypothetical protein